MTFLLLVTVDIVAGRSNVVKYLETTRESDTKQDIQYVPHPQRRFLPNETYVPRDLNNENIEKYIKDKQKQTPEDVCEKYGINPLKVYRDGTFLSRFLTRMAYMKPKSQTGLSTANQRKMTKAVKRAKAMGLLPFTYNTTGSRARDF
ncbi:hypothetical protein SpCBS45565_g01027 [Spizellomyces sp. 'palustris']|nr:hypothetical protein SpCBS45565_g01027 [Spizellomyces sp. 'palustris']